MFRQRPAVQTHFHAISATTASFPVFSRPVIMAALEWVGVATLVCVCVCLLAIPLQSTLTPSANQSVT